MNDFALVCENIGMQFGGLAAVSNFDLSISERALYGLIGPNGAGKTTVFNIISGVLSPTAGSVKLFGKDITGLNPDEIARMGIARTFQNIRLFRNLTVLENVLVGHHLRREATLGEALLALPRYRKEESGMLRTSGELLEDVGLEDVAHYRASALPYGQQRRLEIARALATKPRVLLLDEPAAGMNPAETEQLMQLILDVRDRYNLTILLIEHEMKVVMNICERMTVLDHGQIIAEGTPSEIQSNERVIKAYLGGGVIARH
ncbi:MAG: ABC transporter ATP-binding protein [Firmicutes bacterium]|jgi:branched-chain amino acid transport system ATP-binding protein|nr:ABC transporter ATP-binding protein [Bacillota bacterium]